MREQFSFDKFNRYDAPLRNLLDTPRGKSQIQPGMSPQQMGRIIAQNLLDFVKNDWEKNKQIDVQGGEKK